VPSSYPDSAFLSEMITILDRENKTLQQLQKFIKGGYRKIETIDYTSRNMQWIVFLTRVNDQEIINVLVIDPEKFISQVLDPKIQEIAKGKFHIAAYRSWEDLPFYTSNKQFNPGKITYKEPFWLLKNYQIGI